MNKQEIKEKVIAILKKYTRREEVWENFNDNSDILNDLKINSARLVDIILDIEDEFDLEVEDEAMDRIRTINDVVEIIAEKKAEKKD